MANPSQGRVQGKYKGGTVIRMLEPLQTVTFPKPPRKDMQFASFAGTICGCLLILSIDWVPADVLAYFRLMIQSD
jgi:hypothetical protein